MSTATRAVAGAALLLLGLAANAGPHRQLDLRNQSDAGGEYSVLLCSRPSPAPAGLPGHAFVAYSHQPPIGGKRIFFALGFTTSASAVKGLLSYSALLAKPAGYLDEENFSHVKEQCLVLLVNRPDFEKAYAKAVPYAGVPALDNLRYAAVYSLTRNDCVTFLVSVAGLFTARGLKVPERNLLDLPEVYLRKLIDGN